MIKVHETQFDLFGGMIDHGPDGTAFVRNHARASDPDTSKAAAESVAEGVTLVQKRVLDLHSEHPEGLTDEELTDLYIETYGPTGESSIRSRRHDLTSKGKFEDTGLRRELRSGRKGIVWRLNRERV
jgi:hypothetical protein